MGTFTSDISGAEFSDEERVSGKLIRPTLMKLIREDHPDFDESKSISSGEMNFYREKYVVKMLTSELGKITKMDDRTLETISKQGFISNPEDAYEDDEQVCTTYGQRIADKVADFGGSWTFIIAFLSFIFVWIAVNVFIVTNKNNFDPYPFILLNLILSCIAALQAPVIMMSQNRQEEKDRQRARKDYLINLKCELEIRMLHEKMDHLIMHQQKELLEFQRVQVDLMKDILKGNSGETK